MKETENGEPCEPALYVEVLRACLDRPLPEPEATLDMLEAIRERRFDWADGHAMFGLDSLMRYGALSDDEKTMVDGEFQIALANADDINTDWNAEVVARVTRVLRGRLAAPVRTAEQVRSDSTGTACADFQAAVAALEGCRIMARPEASLPRLDHLYERAETRAGRQLDDGSMGVPDVSAVVLSELLRRGLRVADEIAYLTAGGYFVGAWARWRTLFELAVSAAFIQTGAYRKAGGDSPRTADEERFRQLPADRRRRELAKRYLLADSLHAHRQAIAFRHYLARNLRGDLDDAQLAWAQQQQDTAYIHLGGRQEYLWAFPGYPQQAPYRPASVETMLVALDAADQQAFWARDDSIPSHSQVLLCLGRARFDGRRRVHTLQSLQALWLLGSEATHRSTITPWDAGVYGASSLMETWIPLKLLCEAALPESALAQIWDVFGVTLDASVRAHDAIDSSTEWLDLYLG